MTQIIIIHGTAYKIGSHGYVFYRDPFGDWIRCQKTPAQLAAAISRTWRYEDGKKQ